MGKSMHFYLLLTDIFHHWKSYIKSYINQYKFPSLIDIVKRDIALDIDYHKA